MRDQILMGTTIIAAGVIVAGFFIGGRYVVTPFAGTPGGASIAIVDRFTGSAIICNGSYCHPAQQSP